MTHPFFFFIQKKFIVTKNTLGKSHYRAITHKSYEKFKTALGHVFKRSYHFVLRILMVWITLYATTYNELSNYIFLLEFLYMRHNLKSILFFSLHFYEFDYSFQKQIILESYKYNSTIFIKNYKYIYCFN